MSIFNKIGLLFISVVFLLSSTGLFLIFHECHTCEISEIYINTDHYEHDHYEYKQEHDHLSEMSCCSGMTCENTVKYDHNCCEDDIYFLKIAKPYIFSFSKIKFQEVSFKVNNFINNIDIDKNNSIHISSQIIKPPDLFGTDLLHDICILRL